MKLKALVLALALIVLASSSALAARPVTVHFFVIPAAMTDEKLHDLNTFLIKSAGGFTASRSTGGDTGTLGKAYAPENLSYTVSAPKNLGKEIGAYLKKELGLPQVFLLTWPASRLED